MDLESFVKCFNVEGSTIYSVEPDPARDETDEIVEFWHKQNPDLDVTAKTLAIRLRRASQHFERAVRTNLAANGVDEYWEASCNERAGSPQAPSPIGWHGWNVGVG